MKNEVTNLITHARTWLGYLEKNSDDQLDDFTANAGRGNYTCFARDYCRDTGLNFQAQPWCAMFVSEVFVQAFGLDAARKLLGEALYHYCPTGVSQFQAIGRWSTEPEPGAVIFFTNGSRAYHTGIVAAVSVRNPILVHMSGSWDTAFRIGAWRQPKAGRKIPISVTSTARRMDP